MSGFEVTPINPNAISADQGSAVKKRLTLINARFDGLIVSAKSGLTSDSLISALYVEFKILLKDQNGVVLQIKGSALLRNGEIKGLIKKLLQKGVDKQIILIRLLKVLLKRIKSRKLQASSAKKLAEGIISIRQLIDAAGLEGGRELAELARELNNEYVILLGSTLSGQLEAIAKKSSKPSPGSSTEDALAFLDLLHKYDLSEVVQAVIRENNEAMREIDEQAAKRKEKEKVSENRMTARKEDEKITRKKVKARKAEIALAVKTAERKTAQAVSYFDQIKAQIHENLMRMDLDKLSRKALV